MSKMSSLALDIQEAIEAGELTFAEIAAKYEVPIDWVQCIFEQLDLEPEYDGQPDEADRKSTRLNSSHIPLSRMPSSA